MSGPTGRAPRPAGLREAREEVAVANRILVRERILDGFGHVSARHPQDPSKFLLARNTAPGTVVAGDIQVYDLHGATSDPHPSYLERFIHAEIYRARPDVNGIVHSHSAAVIPYSIVSTPLRAAFHMASFLGDGVPVFDIRDVGGTETDLLVRDAATGRALAATLGGAAVVLMRGHGSTAVGASVPDAVFRAVYTEANARVQTDAGRLGEPTFLTTGESSAATATNRGQLNRTWELWTSRARLETSFLGRL